MNVRNSHLRVEARLHGGAARVMLTALVVVAVAGCSAEDAGHASRGVAETSSVADVASVKAWSGRWLGPEGTYLDIAGDADNAGRYRLTIRNLDGPRTFDGVRVGDHIEFERDGARESIRSSDGDGTGMKWLAGKKHCLVIHRGEGYCRD